MEERMTRLEAKVNLMTRDVAEMKITVRRLSEDLGNVKDSMVALRLENREYLRSAIQQAVRGS